MTSKMSVCHENSPCGFVHLRDSDTSLVYYLGLFENMFLFFFFLKLIFQPLSKIFNTFLL